MAMRSCRRDLTSRNAGWTVKSVVTDRKGRPWTGAPPCEPGRRPAVHPVITGGGVGGAQPRGPDGATTSPARPRRAQRARHVDSGWSLCEILNRRRLQPREDRLVHV